MTTRIVCVILALESAAIGQETDPTATTQPTRAAGQRTTMPSIIQELPDYTGDFWNRSFLTGDWGGARTKLAENGILFELGATQVFQSNAHGGKDTNNAFRYSGSADYTIKFDTARMGLWPGGLLTLRGETQFGQSINRKTGSILSPNFDALLPVPDDSGITTLSEVYFTQALSEKFVLAAGKMDLMVGDANVFAHDERTQFMNSAFRVNPVLLTAGPYTAMAAGAIWMPTDWLTVSTFINDNDPDGAATKTGLNTAFHGREWWSVAQEYAFKWKPFGQAGHQRVGWFWTSRDLTVLDQDTRVQLPRTLSMRGGRSVRNALSRLSGLGSLLGDVETISDDWGFYYNFDQYLYTEKDDPTQGIGIFGRFGLSSGQANPFEEFYSIGLGGKGIIPDRDQDTFGVGYYYANLSDDLPAILGAHSEQGVEVYYNIEVTPWLHVTPDLQVIVNPGGGFQDRDVAVVCGLRVQMSF
jgi:porin